ncbi:MAG: hypothetical protein WCK80_02390 [bacterium]
METMPLSAADSELVKVVSDFLRAHYKRNVHHVASVVVAENNTYFGLHLDTSGHDVCAEPIAMSNALVAGETVFRTVVAVHWDGNDANAPELVSPCGDCRQMLIEYAPQAKIILAGDVEPIKVSINSLLPYAYINPKRKNVSN